MHGKTSVQAVCGRWWRPTGVLGRGNEVLVGITFLITGLTMVMRSRDTTDLSLEYSRLSSTAIAMITKNKVALITEVTGQDGAYLDEFLQRGPRGPQYQAAHLSLSTPIELTCSSRIHVNLRAAFRTIACPPTSTGPTQLRSAAQPRHSANDPQTPRGKSWPPNATG